MKPFDDYAPATLAEASAIFQARGDGGHPLAGNLCHCTGDSKIFEAVLAAAGRKV